MPRSPVEKETQEEDARVSRLNGEVPVFDLSPANSRRGHRSLTVLLNLQILMVLWTPNLLPLSGLEH